MADNRYELDVVVNASKAIAETAKFTKAQQKSIKNIEKSNSKLDRQLVVQRRELSITRRELAKYSAGKHEDAAKAKEAADAHKVLSKSIAKTTKKIRAGKRAISEHRRELEQLQRAADKGVNIKAKPLRDQYRGRIGPMPANAPMMGPGGPGLRGFQGQVGSRAGLARRAQNLRLQSSATFSAIGGAAGGGGLLAPLGSGIALQQSVSGALDLDTQRRKLKLLSEQYGEYDQILKIIDNSSDTFNKSQREATSEFANVFARLRPLGVELHQIKGVYEGFNSVAIASGATSNASRIAFMQLAQAIGSGKLAGDEFRSISEQIPGVLIPIAKELDVNVGSLKKMASEGKLTSDVLINALANGVNISKEEIKAFLAEQPAQKFKALGNAFSDLGVVIGDVILPLLLPLVEGLTNALRFIIELPEPIRNVIVLLGTAALAITGLAVAFKTLGLGIGVKFVASLAATALGFKGLGVAAALAMPKLLLLKKVMLALGKIGFIAIGVNIIINGLDKLRQLEARFDTLGGGTKKFIQSIGGSALSEQEIDTILKDNQKAITRLRAEGNVSDDFDASLPIIPKDQFTDDKFDGTDDAARQQLGQVIQRRAALLNLKANARFKTPEDRDKADAARAKAKLEAQLQGSGADIAGQLAKAEANNALRLTQKRAQIALKVARDEYKLRAELEKSQHQLQEANLVGVARETQQILNAQIAGFRGLEQREQQLEDEVTKAEERLRAAELRLTQATGPVDAERAAGAVSIANQDLSGAKQNLGNFQTAAPTMIKNIQSGVGAQLTEDFRQQTEQLQIQAAALSRRNELIDQGASPEVIEGELAKLEIDRRANEKIAQATLNNTNNATAIARIKTEAQAAKDAIDQLTAAQSEGTNQIRDYINTSMEFVTDIQGRILDIASTIEQGISTAIQGVVDGTLTASQAFGQFFASVGKAFLKMAADMIAKLIIIKLLKTAIGLFGGGGADVSDGASATDAVAMGSSPSQAAAVAAGGAVEWNSDMAVNAGNILDTFAKGGIVTGPTAALIGEGGMNEAVVPLPNGRAIPVDMRGAAGGNVTSNVTVNVSTDGETSSSGSDGAAKLGKAIDTAVRKVILDERRSGGLLYSGR